MLYVNDQDLRSHPIDWHSLAEIMTETLRLLDRGEYSQPIKPYLKYKDPKNRIISMPAYLGGDIDKAGIKWISSFPNNPQLGLPRAHSVIVLNDAQTGRPEAILNSPLPSIARTASISGLMIRSFLKSRSLNNIRLGIVGWGPIGQHHAHMAAALFGDLLDCIRIFDLKEIDKTTIPQALRKHTIISNDWRDVYQNSNIFITCTVSEKRYIDCLPPKGTLLLNISLRDYKPEIASQFKGIVIDDWEEVCRENTDIEQLHLHHGLTQSATYTLTDAVLHNGLDHIPTDESIFFNPMGMAVFDLAAAVHYMKQANMYKFGLHL